MKNICLIVNTTSKNSDVWPVFFDKIEKHVPIGFFNKKYIFVDKQHEEIPEDYKVVLYDEKEVYQQQFSSCIDEVEEEYCIYISEDYILYDSIITESISRFIEALQHDNSISFIRFMRGGVYDGPFEKYSDNLFYVPSNKQYFYTNQAALWRTKTLGDIHKKGPKLHIANTDWQNSFEYRATQTCKDMKLNGLFCYYDEKKRGLYHYDSSVFPHISTALVKGKWNMSEYPREMTNIIKEYKINIRKRGWT